MRRAAGIALIVGLLAGCSPVYENPDDRSHARGAELAEALANVEPQPLDLDVWANYDSIRITMDVGDLTGPEIRDIVEPMLQVVSESRIASLPVRIQLRHDQASDATHLMPLEWMGYDPARAERYFAAVEVWLMVLADPDVQFEEDFEVQGAYVSGHILVFDDRDIAAYRAELVATLEAAGYVEPYINVEAGD